MVNKQSLWFVTLFSLIIVLSIYYFSSDQTSLNVSKNLTGKSYTANKNNVEDNLSVLKVTDDESTVGKIDELQSILLDSESTLEEKNDAYEKLEVIGNSKTKEEQIERLIDNEFNYKSFVKINDNHINIVLKSNVHNTEIANNVIRKVQEELNENVYVSIKFEDE